MIKFGHHAYSWFQMKKPHKIGNSKKKLHFKKSKRKNHIIRPANFPIDVLRVRKEYEKSPQP
jgi:hypothetical protein